MLLAAWASAYVLGACGGGGSGSPSPEPRAVDRANPASDSEAAETALPADLPERLEVEIRRRTADGEDRVLKLTPAGVRYGVSHGKARLAVRYRLPEDALASLYATLRHEGFDGLRTVPYAGPDAGGGTSLRVSTGTETYAVTSMGRQRPALDDAEAFTRCLAAAEDSWPAGRSDVVVRVRWDASMQQLRGQTAGLDIDAGEDLVGVHRVTAPATPSGPGSAPEAPLATFELHLARARPLELQLRQNSARTVAADGTVTADGTAEERAASRSSLVTVRAGVDRGVEVAFDATQGEVVVRPLPAAPP